MVSAPSESASALAPTPVTPESVAAHKKAHYEKYYKHPTPTVSTPDPDSPFQIPASPILDIQEGTAGREEGLALLAELRDQQRIEDVERARLREIDSPVDERFGGPVVPMVDIRDELAMLSSMASDIAIREGHEKSSTATESVFKSLRQECPIDLPHQGHILRLDCNKIDEVTSYKKIGDPMSKYDLICTALFLDPTSTTISS